MRKFRRAKWDAADIFRAEIGAAEVNVLLTGIGARQAAQEVSKIAWGAPDTVEFCVSSGLTGGLRPEFQIGQILVARSIVAQRAPAGRAGRMISGSAPLVSFAEDCGATAVGRFYSAERAISLSEEKRELSSSADAVEMESFSVLSRARASGVPGVAIRCVSDTVDEDLPLDMNEVFKQDGGVSIPRVLGQLALRPRSIPGLVKLGQHSKRAAESLGAFLDRYIREFSKRARALESNSMGMPN